MKAKSQKTIKEKYLYFINKSLSYIAEEGLKNVRQICTLDLLHNESSELSEVDRQILTIKITIPKGFVNIGITNDYIFGDTNDRSNWNIFKFPLPAGRWSLQKQEGQLVTLERIE